MSEAEFQQLMRTKQFKPFPYAYIEGRFFAETIADAIRWARVFGHQRIIVADFPDEISDSMMRWEKMDGIGPARLADWKLLMRAEAIEEARDE